MGAGIFLGLSDLLLLYRGQHRARPFQLSAPKLGKSCQEGNSLAWAGQQRRGLACSADLCPLLHGLHSAFITAAVWVQKVIAQDLLVQGKLSCAPEAVMWQVEHRQAVPAGQVHLAQAPGPKVRAGAGLEAFISPSRGAGPVAYTPKIPSRSAHAK